MTTKHNYDKKKLIILRAVLIIIGAGVGGAAVWQYFVYFPDIVRGEFKAVITAVSAALLAAILGLSAKPFYRLGAGIGESVGGAAVKLGGKGVAAVVLGLIAAVVAALLVDVVMASFEKIWAVRLLVDVLVYIVFAAFFCYGFTRWLSESNDEAGEVEEVKRGYLLSAECLTDERVLSAVDTLINVKVSDGAYKALCLRGDADAVRRLDALVSLGSVELVRCKKQFGTDDEYREFEKQTAEKRRLKYVALTGEGDVSLTVFEAPSDAIKAKYAKGEAVPEKQPEPADAPIE